MNIFRENSTIFMDASFKIPQQVITVSMTACSLNLILALPFNIYVLWLVLTGADGKTAAEIFVLNLTVSELFYCAGCVCYFIGNQVQYFHSIFMLSQGLVYVSRPLFQSCVCVERYLAVVHPVLFLRSKPMRYRAGCCLVIWLLVSGGCIISLYSTDISQYQYSFWFNYVLVLSVQLFCCLSVLRALKRPSPGDGERERSNHVKRRAFIIILIIMVSTTMNYLVYLFTIPIQCCVPLLVYYVINISCGAVAAMTGAVPPLLYLHRAGKLPCMEFH